MEHQSLARHQRTKGANIKQALQAMVLLAVCVWLVYQIKNSENKTENYDRQTKLVVGYGVVPLGRKGTPSRMEEGALPDLGNVDSAGEASKESSSGRDDGCDGAKEGKADEEFGHMNEELRTNEGKEMELEAERQHEVYMESSRSDSDQKEQGNEMYPRIPIINDSQGNDKKTNGKSGFSMKDNDGDEDPSIGERETGTQENVMESATNGGMTETIDGVQSFHDENGVPPDGNETELVFGQGHILHEENISSFSKGSRHGKSNIYEVVSGEDSNVEVTLEGSKSDDTADAEINTGSVTHVDDSGIN